MNVILLSGGSGKRLWPLSNEVRSKQFLKIFKGPGEEYISMVQRVYGQLLAVDPGCRVTVATSKQQVSALRSQLGDGVDICVEPCRRDTFAAVALAAAYLRDQKGLSLDETVVVCPVDPFVDGSFFQCLKRLERLAGEGEENLYLMGITPSYPSAKYGYIMPSGEGEVSGAAGFREKPDEETARRYIREGALWNGGVFAFRLGYMLEKARERIGFSDYEGLLAGYEGLESISIDYAVAEHERKIGVLKFGGHWKDLGTWNTLTEAMGENVVGRALLGGDCRNLHVINELNVPVLCMGLKDTVVAAGPDGILVSDKKQSSYIKPLVDKIDQQIMYAEKSWGSYQVMDVEPESMTIKVTLRPGHSMNYHSHEHRDEVWTVLEGSGYAVVDGACRRVGPGDVVRMPAGSRHTLVAGTQLKVMEVQLGREISVKDKVKYEEGRIYRDGKRCEDLCGRP